jgi:hypothetical protein
MELIKNKAIYTTVAPGLDMIEVYPEHAFIEHDAQPGALHPRRGALLAGVFSRHRSHGDTFTSAGTCTIRPACPTCAGARFTWATRGSVSRHSPAN